MYTDGYVHFYSEWKRPDFSSKDKMINHHCIIIFYFIYEIANNNVIYCFCF